MMFDTQSNKIRPAGRTARRRPGGRALQNVGLLVALIPALMICSSAEEQDTSANLKKFLSEDYRRWIKDVSVFQLGVLFPGKKEYRWFQKMQDFLACLSSEAAIPLCCGEGTIWNHDYVVTHKPMDWPNTGIGKDITKEEMVFICLCRWDEETLCKYVNDFIRWTAQPTANYRYGITTKRRCRDAFENSIKKHVADNDLNYWINTYIQYRDILKAQEDVANVIARLAEAEQKVRFLHYAKTGEIKEPVRCCGKIQTEPWDSSPASLESSSSEDQRKHKGRRRKREGKRNTTRKPTSWSSIFWTSAAIVVVLTVIVTLAPHIVSIAQMWG